MWLDELEILKKQYIEYKDERIRLMNGDDAKPKKKIVAKSTGKKIVSKKTLVVEEE